MASDQEGRRIAKLEQRALEAENAIVKMKSYLDLLTQRAGQGSAVGKNSEESKVLEENLRLKDEVQQLKKKLVEMETLRGIVQVPLPSPGQVPQRKPAEPQDTSSKEAAKPKEPVKPKEAAKPKEASSGGQSTEKKQSGKDKSKEAKPKKDAKAQEESKTVDVSRLDMRVGKILSVARHPDADTLYVEQIDVGEEKPRTILSGLVEHYTLEQMQDRIIIAMCNLKPAKMRGIMSEGMVMCASTESKCEFIDPPPGSVPGDRIVFAKYPGTPDAVLNPKKKVWEQVKPDLHTDDNRVALYKDDPFQVEGKGICTAPTLTNVIIK